MQVELCALIALSYDDSLTTFRMSVVDEAMGKGHDQTSENLEGLSKLIEELRGLAVGDAAAACVRRCCEKSRVLLEMAILLSCGGEIDTKVIQRITKAHRDFLSLPVVVQFLALSSSAEGKSKFRRQCRYIENIELRLQLLGRLTDSLPHALFSGSVYSQVGQKWLTATNEVRDWLLPDITDTSFLGEVKKPSAVNVARLHLIWLSEFFRYRIDAELHELAKEVDSLWDSGPYHSQVLGNIVKFIAGALEQLKKGEANGVRILATPRFAALSNSIEACVGRVDELKNGLEKFHDSVDEDTYLNGKDFEIRDQLCQDLSEIPFLLAAISGQLVSRRSFTELFYPKPSSQQTIRVVCYPSADNQGKALKKEDSVVVAQSLDIDIVAAGQGVVGALRDLDAVLRVWMQEFAAPQHEWIHPSVAPARFHAAFADGEAQVPFTCRTASGVTLEVRYFDAPVPNEYTVKSRAV